MDFSTRQQLGALLRANLGIVTAAQLQSIGLGEGQIRHLARSGRLPSVAKGVYRSPDHVRSLEHRARLSSIVARGAVCFPTAAQMWDLRRAPRDARIHVVIPWSAGRKRVDGAVVHRTRWLPEEHLTISRDGVPLTSPLRTVFDAGRHLGPDDVESMIEDGLHRGLFDLAMLRQLLDDTAHPCRDGTSTFVAVMARREAARPVASEYELRLERAMRQRGFPPLVRQPAIDLGGGQVVHPDLGLPDDGFYVEVDHRRWHGGTADVAYDTWRDRQVRLLGLWVERVSDRAIDRRLKETVEDLWNAWHHARMRNAEVGREARPRRLSETA